MIRLDVMYWISHWVAVVTRLSLHLRRITLAPLLALSGLAGTAGTLQAADFAGWPSALKDIAQRQRIAPQQVAMWVAPVDGGPDRLAIDVDTPRSVASVMKLFTTGTALQTLGPAYTWKTEVGLGGPLGTDGHVAGPIYLRGSGDPGLVLERVQLMLSRWRAAGLHVIEGDWILDRSLFQLSPHDPAAFDGAALKPYNAGPDALLLNHRALILRFRPDDALPQRVKVTLEPELAEMEIVNRLKLHETAPCGDWREGITLSLEPDSHWHLTSTSQQRRWHVRLDGSYPKACLERDWPLLWTGDHADDYAARLLTPMWRQLGGHLQGQVRSGAWPEGLPVWSRWTSPPLSQAVQDINKFSNNVMARQLFLTLGTLAPARPVTLPQAQTVVAEHVRAQTTSREALSACAGDHLVLDNGSGLSRTERSSARCLGEWMRALWRSPVMPEMLASLPIAGVDGTARRLNGASGKVHLKTGSLDGTSAIAGYAHADSGRRYVVIGVVNGQTDGARPLLDALMSWAVQDISTQASISSAPTP
ncbi:MAG: D-alanyl-D-alanine carboxypeptidase/D-alanyl-D-alanine-endopeptidase [Aquabacterium sp.]